MEFYFLVCNVCDFEDTKISNGDCDACSECYSVEQGFTEFFEDENDNREEV
jgi:hypothetical protein